jgi:hypothetical protein
MKKPINGKDYRLPRNLNSFQEALYVHLINWKWEHITKEPGYSKYRGQHIPYDAILPTPMADEFRVVYLPIREALRQHARTKPFRFHRFFNHMASSQAANVNLFLPILYHPSASAIFSCIKEDFASLAVEQLDHGYCLEFWGGNFGSDAADRGPLGDKSGNHGTDSDIAIAYRNHQGELCLWLIEHKLTEKEFTPCSGPKSKDRDEARHHCSSSFADILRDKHTCFHHDFGQRKYWDITERNQSLFVNHATHTGCPFQGGMNQLWRNQLLALAIEQQGNPYKHTHFSVVRHPGNKALDASLTAYKDLIDNNPRFSSLSSVAVIEASERHADKGLHDWIAWYRELYQININPVKA